MNFWYAFDNTFLFKSNAEIRGAIAKVDPYGKLLNLFYYHVQQNTINSGGYKNDIEKENIKESIKMLIEEQLKIMDESFKNNVELESKAFELFSQGLLFDNKLGSDGLPRRPSGTKIHKMDSDVTGFVAWHAFIRAAVVLQVLETTNRLLQIDREIALSASILASLIKEGRKPQQSDNPNLNKPLDNGIILQLKNYWMNQSFEDMDKKIIDLEKSTITDHL